MAPAQKLFGKEWLSAPLRVGAIAPSSTYMAAAITEGLSEQSGPVIELGPGTGVFTRALLARGIPPQEIAAIELGREFATALRLQHPEIRVIEGDASRVAKLSPFAPGSVGQVICGLPLLSIPADKVMRILSGSFKLLKPGGTFRLFTYGPTSPVAPAILKRVGLTATRRSAVLFNLPPASVYELRQDINR